MLWLACVGKKMLINLKRLLPLLVIVSTIIFVFKDLQRTFYQQDEWNGLGLAFAQGARTIFNGTSGPLDLIFVKGRILSNLIYYLFLHYFPFQNSQMAIFAIGLHILATILVYLLIRKFIKSALASLFGAPFFAVNAVSHGAVTWAFVAISAVGSSIFVLLSLLFFFNYTENGRTKWLLLTGLMLYVSLWFKETGLYLFIFFPFAALLFKRYTPKSFLKTFWLFLVPFFLIVGYRILELRLRTTESNLYITGASENFFSTIWVRMVLYPLTSFSLMFVPGGQFIEFARAILKLNYPFFAAAPNYVLIAQSVVLDLLALLLTGLLLIIISPFLRKEKPESSRVVLFWLAFTLVSFLPYVVLSKDFAYLESRYYYVPVVGAAFLLAWLLGRVRKFVGKAVFFGVAIPLYLLYLLLHTSVVRHAIDDQVVLSNTRKDFITQLKTQVPTLDNKKNVFYTTSDKHYWADTNMLPFQQGSGYTLMVLYYDSGRIPPEFLKDGYLFEIGSQGYKEVGDEGFGFFWDEKELNKATKAHNLPPNSVIRLNYDSKEGKLNRI